MRMGNKFTRTLGSFSTAKQGTKEGIRVVGKNRLYANLRWINNEYLARLIAQVNTSLAIVHTYAKRDAPVKTGQLRAGIKATQARLLRSGVWRGYVRSEAPYAAWVEFGAGRGRKGKSKERRKTAYRHGHSIAKANMFGIKKNQKLIGAAIHGGKLKKYKRPYLGPAFAAQRPLFFMRIRRILDSVPREIAAR